MVLSSAAQQELENLGYVTKYGSCTWAPSTILGIIKNEKYKGDLLLGKTFTVEPISKQRLDNMGEEDQFYIHEHHEPIISEEVFEKAQEILNRRNKNRGKIGDGKKEKYSRKYAFSCMLECGFCGSTLSRRNWHSGSNYTKVIWQCVAATKKGKKYCPDSKGIPEQAIEEAFIESYRLLCDDNKDILDEFLQRMDDTLSSSTVNKQLSKLDKEVDSIEGKKSKLVDMRLEDTIDKASYEAKYSTSTEKQEQLLKEREKLQETAAKEKDIKRRLRDFKKTLEQNEVLSEFDRYVFESIVEKVIVGGYDEDENKDPAQLTFVYKTGLKNNVDGSPFKPKRKMQGKNIELLNCVPMLRTRFNLCLPIVIPTHVEMVVLLSHKKADSYINVNVDFGEGKGKIPMDKIAERVTMVQNCFCKPCRFFSIIMEIIH
ncbi:recombinase family protein [Clostridium sporogenes]|uniref:recombinase family protein n=2 Tax=Clostridium sporogenes TaxID=1509 RepID=UPI0039DF5D50